jgi:putative transposase
MREANLRAVIRLPKTTKDSKGQSAGYVYENLLKQDFNASNQIKNGLWI